MICVDFIKRKYFDWRMDYIELGKPRELQSVLSALAIGNERKGILMMPFPSQPVGKCSISISVCV